MFRTKIVLPAHRDKLIEYDGDARTLCLSPLGVAYVETNLLPRAGAMNRSNGSR